MSHLLLLIFACAGQPAATPSDGASGPPAAADTGAETTDGGDAIDADWTATHSAYSSCVTDAECDAGSACTPVEGHGTAYCAPPCDPSAAPATATEQCDPTGAFDGDVTCQASGRCAMTCSESADTCPSDLACDIDVGLCAGEASGQAGYYGTCTHPNTDGTDCPPESSCFGGDYLSSDWGICMPWCDDDLCEAAPADSTGVSPICYDVGYDHPMCVLLCVPGSSTCPDEQTCFDLGSVGVCGPPDASY